MRKLSATIKKEFRELIPPTLFFFLALHVLALVRVLMLKGTGIALSTSLQVTVAALILGKAVLIADMLPLINRYPHKALIYNVLWKTAIYVLISVLIHYLEHLFGYWKEAGGLMAANHKLLAEIIWPHFWAIQLLLVVLTFTYCTMHEFTRVIGANKVRAMFFELPPGAQT